MLIKSFLAYTVMLISTASFAQKPPSPVVTDGDGVIVNPFGHTNTSELCTNMLKVKTELISTTNPITKFELGAVSTQKESVLLFYSGIGHKSLDTMGILKSDGRHFSTSFTYKVRNLIASPSCSDVSLVLTTLPFYKAPASSAASSYTVSSSCHAKLGAFNIKCPITTVLGKGENVSLGRFVPLLSYYITVNVNYVVPNLTNLKAAGLFSRATILNAKHTLLLSQYTDEHSIID